MVAVRRSKGGCGKEDVQGAYHLTGGSLETLGVEVPTEGSGFSLFNTGFQTSVDTVSTLREVVGL